MSENKEVRTEELRGTEQETPETSPRRRRRADRYREEEPEQTEERYTDHPVLESGSETAREVANRYRRQQEQQKSEEDTTRVPDLSRLSARNRMSQPREQVGYASGRMGMSYQDRARMSEAGRSRLAEENRIRGALQEEAGEGGRYAPAAENSRLRKEKGPGINPRDPRYSGKPAVRQEKPTRGGIRWMIAAIAILLLLAVLLSPADGIFGGLRQRLTGLMGRQEEIAQDNQVISFIFGGQDSDAAPAQVDFFALTGKGVADVRLLAETGEPLATDNLRNVQENGLLWELNWYTEEPYDGSVTLQVLTGEIWENTEYALQVTVLPPKETQAEETGKAEEEIPVVFATEEPTATPEPTPEPEAEPADEDEASDAEQEGLGEGEAQEAALPPVPETGADPDDPSEAWEEPAETVNAEEEAEPAEEAEEENSEENPEPEAAAESASAPMGETAEEAEGEEAPPERLLLTASAAESADPSLISTVVVYNGTKKVVEYARADKEKIHMPVLGEYTKRKMGVLTFRTDAFRQNGAVGTVKGMDHLSLGWTAEAGSVKGAGQTYYGIGWTGQPAIVKWSKEVREQSEMYEAKKEKSGLKEVIAAGQDGRIYFLDLSDGTATRNSIKLGYPMKASPSVHPGGAPYMTVGQFARKMSGHTGTIGLRQYNLYLQKELSLIDGLDGKNNRPYNQVGSFETSALIDRTTGCMVTAGTNGMLYLINLNSEFDYAAGTYSQSPTTVAMKSKVKGEKDASTAVEASVAMYDRYVYYADMGGILRCVDTNTLKVSWAVTLKDGVESTPALDWHGEDGLDLYAATLYASGKRGTAEVICFDALTGEERWTAAVGVRKDTKNKTVSGFRASPVIGQNRLSEYVYYTVNNLSDEGREQLNLNSENAALIALNKEDGRIVWAVGLSGSGYSSPVAVYDGDGNGAVIQCSGDGKILMVDGETGTEKASLQVEGAIEASPAVYDGMMVVGTTEKGKNNIYGIKIE